MPSVPSLRHPPIDLMTASDQELLREFLRPGLGHAERAEHAFRGLVERHLPMVRAICQRVLMNHADSDDAAQAVFLVLWKKAADVPASALGGWLHRTATLVSRNLLRSRRNRQKYEKRAADMATETTCDPTDWADLREVLDGELDQLAEKYRVPLIMFHLEERPVQEIAAALSVSENTIGTWLVRGRELLAKRLVRRGIAVGAVALVAGLTQAVQAEPVPPQLVASTVSEASRFGGNISAVIGGDPSAATRLAHEVLNVGRWTPWKWAVGGLLTCAAGVSLAVGAWLHSSGSMTADMPAASNGDPPGEVSQATSIVTADKAIPETPAGQAPPLEEETDPEYGGIRGQITVDTVIKQRIIFTGHRTKEEVLDESILVNPQTRGLKNVVIFLKQAPDKIAPSLAAPPNTALVVDNVNGAFVPHTLIARTGQPVMFKNANAYSVNVHTSPVRNQGDNFILKPMDRVGVTIKFPEAEIPPMAITNDIHSWMRAHVLVVDHPYAAVTDGDGKFHINHLPAGTHSFRIWHEKVGYIERGYPVEVAGGKFVDVSLTVEAANLTKGEAKGI